MVLNVILFNLTFIIVSCAALVALNLTCIYIRNVKSKQYQALDKAAQFSLILAFVAISLAIIAVLSCRRSLDRNAFHVDGLCRQTHMEAVR